MRWIIGDIHGMLRPLEGLLEGISRADTDAKLYFVGDYVNRGPQSKGVIDLLLTLKNAKFIRGNHDDIFDQVIGGQNYAPNASNGDRWTAYKWFSNHGLVETLLSYGIDPQDVYRATQKRNQMGSLMVRIPESHVSFIHSLPPVIEEDEFFVCHGRWEPSDFDQAPGIREQLATDLNRRHRLLWGRFTDVELPAAKAWNRVGYFGHTPVDNYPALLGNRDPVPLRGTKIVLLDTAAALLPNGRLTAFCHEKQMCLQADRQGKLLAG